MIRFLSIYALFLGFLLVPFERLFPGDVENSEPLVWETWFVPADVVSTGGQTGATPTRKPKPGFVILEGSGKWDASEFVKALGGEKVPGSEAIYDLERECLIVKNTKENITAIGSAISMAGLENIPAHIVATFAVYECALAAKPENGFAVWPTYADLIGKDPKEVRMVDSISGTARSGVRSKYSRRTASSEKDAEAKKTSLGEDELGMESEVECVMGSDHHIDTNLSFRWRGQMQDRTTASISFTTTFTNIENQPLVIHVAAQENSPGKYLIVTANLWQESPIDWTLESLSKIAKKARERAKIEKALTSPPGKNVP